MNAVPVSGDVSAYLRQHEAKPLLRFITCGSVDDGKSTLIGRLLYESKRLFDDQLAALEADSRRHGTQGERIDYALLLDGLAAEREQGITIDVAYRYFDTDRRKYIVADCPGHEQYTRNMATGASTADLAVVLVDARKGLLQQTRRHSYIISLLGIGHIVLAINKMDLVGYEQDVFERIAGEYRALAAQLGIGNVQVIPLSALEGQNLSTRSALMPWYAGPSLLEHLDAVELADHDAASGQRPAPAGAMGQPPEPGFPRLRRHPCRRAGARRRCGGGAAVGAPFHGQAGAGAGRPAGRGRRRAGGDADPGRRDRRQPRRRHRRRWRPAGGGRPVRRACAVDGRCRTAAWPPVLAADRQPHRGGERQRDQAPGRREHAGKAGGQAAGAERGRLLQPVAGRTHRLRALRAQPRAGWLHPDRPPEQRHRRRRHPGLRPAPRRQRALAASGRGQGRARPHQGADAEGAVVHRPVRRRQVHHRQPGGKAPACTRLPHLHPRRRQCPPRAEPRPRLHRRGPGGEHPPRRRSGAVDGRRRADRAGQLHLAVPRRAADGARALRRGRVHRGIRRRAAGGGRIARREGPVPQGARRADPQLHRHRFALRDPRSAGAAPVRRRRGAGCDGRPGGEAGAALRL
ncbi:putative Sulfate adenylyltransferase [uncultured Stenotrophomonas sp.]|uniref:sulfate adenylyltransferase n=1 Tax=uncultured Stenotrophomonas sp. TaxID=165438 RepID=A0A1Y5Q7E9_9GAMM|nr:putative Sulfate adenylyltransferase [uncultured Stenotrophomonas sp.]